MLFEKFIVSTKSWWHNYFETIQKAQRNGHLSTNGMIVLYPTMMIFTRFPDHYMIELVGASENYKGLTIKQHKEKSIHRYLNQFDDKNGTSVFHLNGELNGFRFLTISTHTQIESLQQRFPQIDIYKSALSSLHDADCALSFGDDFQSASIENSTIVNKRGNLYRVKNILAMYIFTKKMTKGQAEYLYNDTTKDKAIKGIHTVKSSEIIKTTISQFQNIYFQPGLRETTIGDFIKTHPEVIKLAFNAKRFEYEPSLKWHEHDGTCDDHYINPDLMIEDQTGEWHIYDLKTALLDKSRVTKDDRKRRRFIDYVSEGIAQLANYREYFSYEKNRFYAYEKYGITICSPKLILVVGNWDNFDPVEVSQASRQIDKNIELIDYDTFAQLILSGARRIASSPAAL